MQRFTQNESKQLEEFVMNPDCTIDQLAKKMKRTRASISYQLAEIRKRLKNEGVKYPTLPKGGRKRAKETVTSKRNSKLFVDDSIPVAEKKPRKTVVSATERKFKVRVQKIEISNESGELFVSFHY